MFVQIVSVFSSAGVGCWLCSARAVMVGEVAWVMKGIVQVFSLLAAEWEWGGGVRLWTASVSPGQRLGDGENRPPPSDVDCRLGRFMLPSAGEYLQGEADTRVISCPTNTRPRRRHILRLRS